MTDRVREHLSNLIQHHVDQGSRQAGGLVDAGQRAPALIVTADFPPEGIADFHAAGRHSHITGLIRSGASIMEAKELARHADIRQTTKYTHIGMEDRAEGLATLHEPLISTYAETRRRPTLEHRCRDSIWIGMQRGCGT